MNTAAFEHKDHHGKDKGPIVYDEGEIIVPDHHKGKGHHGKHIFPQEGIQIETKPPVIVIETVTRTKHWYAKPTVSIISYQAMKQSS
jgi:hypothetical protein